MTIKRRDYRRSFEAAGNDGRVYKVDEYVDIRNVATEGDPGAEADGRKELLTSEGFHVNRLSKGRYQIVQTFVVLTSCDPSAP
jgi:hypothetical protein